MSCRPSSRGAGIRARRRLCSLGQHPPPAAPGHRSGCWSSACRMVTAATFGPTAATAGRSGTLRRRAVPRQGDLPDAAHDAGAEGRPALRHRGGRSRRRQRQRRRQDRQPAAVRRRHARPGDREVPARRRHLLHDPQACSGCPSDDNIGDPAQVATLSNGLQTAVAGAAAPTSRCRSRSTRRAARWSPGSARRRPRCPATWRWAPGGSAARTPATRRGDRHGARRRSGSRRTTRRSPTSTSTRTTLSSGSAPSAATRRWSPTWHRRRSRATTTAGSPRSPSTSPATATPASTATSGCRRSTHTWTQFHAIDLPPFKADIAAGVDTIMTAHVVFPAVDPSGAPATMSHKILTGVLRDELGFKGLIVTDALDMAGATATYPPNVAPVQAILAGADQLLVPPQMDTAYGAVLDAVRSGTISKQRLDESVYRILLHKYQHGIFRDPFVDPAVAPTVHGRARTTSPPRRRSPTAPRPWSRTTAALLPLAAGPRKVLVAGWGVGTTADDRRRAHRAGRDDAGPRVRDHTVGDRRSTTPSRPRRHADLVVVSTNNAYARRRDHRAAHGVRRRRRPSWFGPCWRPGSRSWSRRCATRTTSRRSPRRRRCSTPTATPLTPGRVAGAGALRRGEPDRPAAGLHPDARMAPASPSRSATAWATDDELSCRHGAQGCRPRGQGKRTASG